MAIEQEVTEILDQTIQAFSLLDLDRLQTLEERIRALAKVGVACDRAGLQFLMEKKHLLGVLLQSCESNLEALNRLRERNERDQWAH